MNSHHLRLLCCSLALWLGLVATSSAGSLAGRTRIELGAGMRSHSHHVTTHVGWDGVDLTTSTGTIGRLSLSHWQDNNLAYVLAYTVHDLETGTWVDYWGETGEETSVVHSLMFGLRYYLPQSRTRSPMRPYFSAGVGPFIGTSHYRETDICCCDVYSEVENMTAFAARLGGGVDFQMSHRFMLGFNAGYNFVNDFPRPINGRANFSGSEFGISFSYLFGRGGR